VVKKLTTPNKKAIFEKALEIYERQNGMMASITPSFQELLEGGYVFSATHALMVDNPTHEAYAHLEKEAHAHGYVLKKESIGYLKSCLKHSMFSIPFDLQQAERTNTLISGGNYTGKSRLACGIASLVSHFKWHVICFDNSGIWRHISDLPCVFTVEKSIPLMSDTSLIYDLSFLKPSTQRKLIEKFLEDFWNYTRRLRRKERMQTLLIFEEFELIGRNARYADNLHRILHVGRNLKIRSLAITTDLALIDPSFIRLCQQRYHGKLGIEENSKRKFRNYYGNDYTRIACEGLEVGDFIYLNRGKLRVVSVPLFEAKRLPQELNTEKVIAQ